VIEFKRGVYESALLELSRLLFSNPHDRVPNWESEPGEQPR
jgi:hypothetical protein